MDYRIWLPKLKPDYIIPPIAQVNNSNYSTVVAKADKDSKYAFKIDEELAKKFGTNQQLSFMFALSEDDFTNIESFNPIKIYKKLFVDIVDNTYTYNLSKSPQIPLYCFRLSDNTDITSIDLWSYKTKSITLQRGGVTILNNVINATNGEDTVLKVSVPNEGDLSIMVLTLDGNIVKYLHRGHINPGEYHYFWDGTNNNNNKVARGLYFIRVVGAGFDETRKVMVVR